MAFVFYFDNTESDKCEKKYFKFSAYIIQLWKTS